MNYGLSESDFLKLLGDRRDGVLGEGVPKNKRKPRPLGKTSKLIIDMMIQDSTCTAEQFVSVAKVSVSAVKKRIKNLTDRGIVIRIGAARGGIWKIQNPSKDEEETTA